MNGTGGELGRRHLLHEASRAILTTHEITKLPEIIVRVSMEVMEADTVSLLLPGIDGALYVAHAYGMAAEIQRATRVVVGQGIAGRVAATLEPLVLNDDASAGGTRPGREGHGRVRSSIVYPLASAGRLTAMLTLNRRIPDRPFGEDDLETVSILASQIMLALENARLAAKSISTEKLAAVGQLAAGIAHEINTPIQFIGDCAVFLRDGLRDLLSALDRYRELAGSDEPVAERLAAIERCDAELDIAFVRDQATPAVNRVMEGATRVAEIVQAVKRFGHPDVGEKSDVDLNRALMDTLTVAEAEYRPVATVQTQFGELPPVACYAGDVNQVFLQLIVNAAHAIAAVERGGALGEIVVSTERDGDWAVVRVRDSGCGIPDVVRDKVFEPFFSTKEVGKGTGLGLSIARSIIVEKHGGTIDFETQQERGTVFTVRIPIQRAQ